MVHVPGLSTIGALEEAVVASAVVPIRARKMRPALAPAARVAGVARSVPGEQSKRVGRGPAEGGGKRDVCLAAAVQGRGTFVNGGVDGFPGVGWLRKELRNAD